MNSPSTTHGIKDRAMLILLGALSLSYWYCLPLVTQNLLGYNEFRGYDFLFVVLIVVLLLKYRQRLLRFFRSDQPGKWAFRLCLWATATLPVTVIISVLRSKPMWALVTVVFLFHLWGFVLAYAAFRMFVTNRAQCFALLDLFLAAGLVEGAIICLQAMGLLPLFWSELYLVYGTRAFSGTLGPNRTLPGHVMILVIVVASAYWRNASAVRGPRLVLAAAAALVCLFGLGLSGSKTAWLVFGVFAVVSLFGQKLRVRSIAFVIIVAVGAVFMVPDSVEEQIVNTYNWRVSDKLSKVDETSTALNKFQAVDSGRYVHWRDGLAVLAEHPWLVPFGGGFNNYHQVSDGASAHNVYITIVTELGIVGLVLYLMWLGWVWKSSSSSILHGLKLRKKDKRVFLSYEIKPLVTALLVSLFAGEILYPYRPCFAFMGMFLFLCALLNHPAMLEAAALKRPVQASRWLPAGSRVRPRYPMKSAPGFRRSYS